MSRASSVPGGPATGTGAAPPGVVDGVVAAALGWEVRTVLGPLTDVRPLDARGVSAWIGFAGAHRFLVVRTGIGPERVRMALAGVDAWCRGARWLLSTGCAGALVPGLEPGTVVVATRIVDDRGDAAGRASDAQAQVLQRWAQVHGIVAHCGAFASVARPLLDAAEKRNARNRLGAIAVEMEGAALAAAAAERGVSFLAVRVILDGVDMAVPDFGDARDGYGLAAAMIRHPLGVGRAARLWPAQRTARAELVRFFRAFFTGDALQALDAGPRSVEQVPGRGA
jgi:nucleoside phosphorylase